MAYVEVNLDSNCRCSHGAIIGEKQLDKLERPLTVSVVQATFFLSSSLSFSLNLRTGVVEGPTTSSASTTTVSEPVDGVGKAQAENRFQSSYNLVETLLKPR